MVTAFLVSSSTSFLNSARLRPNRSSVTGTCRAAFSFTCCALVPPANDRRHPTASSSVRAALIIILSKRCMLLTFVETNTGGIAHCCQSMHASPSHLRNFLALRRSARHHRRRDDWLYDRGNGGLFPEFLASEIRHGPGEVGKALVGCTRRCERAAAGAGAHLCGHHRPVRSPAVEPMGHVRQDRRRRCRPAFGVCPHWNGGLFGLVPAVR